MYLCYLPIMVDCRIIVERVCRLPLAFHEAGTKSVAQMAEEIGLNVHRECITYSAIKSHLFIQSELVESWLRWSADKRSSDGWYFYSEGQDFVIGCLPDGEEKDKRYADRISACAQYIVQEIDDILASLMSSR